MKITIPASLDEAISSLTGIDGLLTAKEWERAAIVYAFTVDGRTVAGSNRNDQKWSIAEFAAKGIAGLSSRDTVQRHRKAWESAVDAKQAEVATPGAEVALPTAPFGEFYVSDRAEQGRSQTIELPTTKNKDKLREHFQRNPDTAADVIEAAAQAAADHPEQAPKIRAALTHATAEHDHRDREGVTQGSNGKAREEAATRYEVQTVLQRMAEFRLAVTKLVGLGAVKASEAEVLAAEWEQTKMVGEVLADLTPGQAIGDEAAEFLRGQS